MQTFSATKFPLKIPAKFLALCFYLISQTAAAEETTTSVQCYGIKDSNQQFLQRSQLLKKVWAKNTKTGSDLVLQGKWHNWQATDKQRTFFAANRIGGQHYTADKIHEKLRAACQKTLLEKEKAHFQNIRYYASDSSIIGYEYPILNEQESEKISNSKRLKVNSNEMLRYAYASGLAYVSKKPDEKEKYASSEKFQELMLFDDEQEVKVIAEHKTPLLHAIALQVPSISSAQGALSEEIIVAFKGTDPESNEDILSDLAIASESFNPFGSSTYRLPLYKEAFDFLTTIIEAHTPKDVFRGYEGFSGEPKTRVVLTGHSLGGYVAADLSVRTGLPTWIFSSPSQYIINDSDQTSANLFANTMPVGNTLNTYLQGDPIVTYSGRYSENRLMYKSTSRAKSVTDKHKLTNVIEAIIENEPAYSSVTADAMMGYGLNN